MTPSPPPKRKTRKTSDPRWSTRIGLIEEHYANQGEDLAWTTDRLRRLCAALQLTPYELGAMLRLKIGEVERQLRTNSFHPTVELHLTLIERAVLPTSKPPVIPDATRL
jgi:hypothetical protein